MPEAAERTLRSLHGRTSTLNEAERTVEVIWSTGAPVKRYDYTEGFYMEELAVESGAIRLDRFDAGMSLLDSHDNYSMDSRLGTVVAGSVRIAGGKAYATVKLSRKQRGEELLRDLIDGHAVQISVGYKTHRYEKIESDDDKLPTFRATDWEPLELSAVTIPADAGAFSRSHQEATMPRPHSYLDDNSAETTDVLERAADPQAAKRKLGLRERRTLVHGMFENRRNFLENHGSEIEELISDCRNMTEMQVRGEVIGFIADMQDRTPTFPYSEVRGTGSSSRSMPEAMAQALMLRVNPQHQVPDDAREYVGRTIPELARSCLEARGVSTIGEGAATLVSRALHTTSDFPEVLSSVGQITLREAYQVVPSQLKQVARQSSVADFRNKTLVQLSEFSDLEKVNEHGEFKRGTFSESKESYRIDTFGKVFGITRQLLINDQLGAFTDVASKLGRAAARFEADFLAKLVESNPVMSGDNKAVFHADHGNLATAAALSQASLELAFTQFRRRKGLAGDIIDVSPKFLVVSPELEIIAMKLLASYNPATPTQANPIGTKLTLVVEPRLIADNAWYLVASPGEMDGLEFSYLSGHEGPEFETRVGFDVDGVETKVRLDFGGAFTEHRGWLKNAGAAQPA